MDTCCAKLMEFEKFIIDNKIVLKEKGKYYDLYPCGAEEAGGGGKPAGQVECLNIEHPTLNIELRIGKQKGGSGTASRRNN